MINFTPGQLIQLIEVKEKDSNLKGMVPILSFYHKKDKHFLWIKNKSIVVYIEPIKPKLLSNPIRLCKIIYEKEICIVSVKYCCSFDQNYIFNY